jgi:hypothetical protein
MKGPVTVTVTVMVTVAVTGWLLGQRIEALRSQMLYIYMYVCTIYVCTYVRTYACTKACVHVSMVALVCTSHALVLETSPHAYSTSDTLSCLHVACAWHVYAACSCVFLHFSFVYL